ncbi:MAG: DUF1461 domain-containing protein [Thiolinea sp.]
MRLLLVLFGCLSVFCISLIILIYLFRQPFGYAFSADVNRLQTDIWQYLLADGGQLLISHPDLGVNEERHLLDVKRLLRWLFSFTVFISCSFVTCLGLPWIKVSWCYIAKGIAVSGLVVTGILLFFVGLVGFNNSFLYFHRLLFVQDTWWFLHNSGLIQAFPISYFQQFGGLYCLVLISVFSMFYYTLSWFRR